jgi:hypothetical protein
MVGQLSNQNVVNVFWCRITPSGSVTQADLDTWTAAFGAAFKTNFTSTINGLYTFGTANAVYFVDGTPTNVLSSTATLTGTGTSSSSEQAGLAMCVSWLSSVYWRGGKPRTYIPASAANVSSAIRSQWASTFITTMTTQSNAFITAVNALTAGSTITATAFGFVSFFTGRVARTPPVFFAITGRKVHPRLAHQRRRDGKWLA